MTARLEFRRRNCTDRNVIGAARMRQMLNRDRNGKLYLRKLAEAGFLPFEDDGTPGISEAELYGSERDRRGADAADVESRSQRQALPAKTGGGGIPAV